jgi:hypothetical protein
VNVAGYRFFDSMALRASRARPSADADALRRIAALAA